MALDEYLQIRLLIMIMSCTYGVNSATAYKSLNSGQVIKKVTMSPIVIPGNVVGNSLFCCDCVQFMYNVIH